jgi:subtilisin family serine protease/subtilisin-like proprotein convertase family protein
MIIFKNSLKNFLKELLNLFSFLIHLKLFFIIDLSFSLFVNVLCDISPKLEIAIRFVTYGEDKNQNRTIDSIVQRYNLTLKEKLFNDFYIFEANTRDDIRKHKRETSSGNNKANYDQLNNESMIDFYEIQKPLVRQRRYEYEEHKKNMRRKAKKSEKHKNSDYLSFYRGYDTQDYVDLDNELLIYKPLAEYGKQQREKYKYIFDELAESFLEAADYEDYGFYKFSRGLCSNGSYSFNDPMWTHQWYLNDGCTQGFHLNITAAWRMGYTGKGVVVTIIDDGLESDHEELASNYDSNASVDLNDNDADPRPRYESRNENKHGTRCAGEVAANGNNRLCGVGVAFNARIGGIRLLDGKITDRLEAKALTYNANYIDIFSASWGPLDDGKTVDGPGALSRAAFASGIINGRHGKGIVYVWAAGNGGRHGDNCNCDGYTSSIYTITIGGATQDNKMPKYGERCSATMASTYSSGHIFQSGIITSDLHNSCTRHHTGTSASAPIAAGMIALVLEANRNLTWRDVQYIIVLTAERRNLTSNDWRTNGVGKHYSHNFGFGLLNAGKMISAALQWLPIEKQLSCEVHYLKLENANDKTFVIKQNNTVVFSIYAYNLINLRDMHESRLKMTYNNHSAIDVCKSNLNYLEHVVSVITLLSGVRGQFIINLISPANTVSNLLEYRRLDKSVDGFKSWPFMSVHFWGEKLIGEWRLEIINNSTKDAYLKEWHLKFYGVHFRQYLKFP